MFERFTENARKVIVQSQEEARKLKQNYIGTEHLLLGILNIETCTGYKVLVNLDVPIEALTEQLIEISPKGKGSPESVPFTPRGKKVLETALREALNLGHDYIGSEHLLLGVLNEKGSNPAILLSRHTTLEQVREEILSLTLGGETEVTLAGVGGRSKRSASKEKGKKSKLLDQFGTNLTQVAREGKLDPVIGRENEVERVMQILARRTKNNPLLIGEPGVGKTAVVEGLAQKIVDGDAPEFLLDKEVYSLELSLLVAGSRYRGDFEERMNKVIREIRTSKNIILFIDEMHTLVGAGASEGAIDASNMIKPLLARGELSTIGATTLKEYKKYIEKDAALERRFQPVKVEEPTVEQSIQILEGLRDRYEAHHGVKITNDALRAAVRLSKRYISDRFLPDKAVDLIDESAAREKIESMKRNPSLDGNLYAELGRVRNEKYDAVANEDYENATVLREQETQLMEIIEEKTAEWQNEQKDVPVIVDEENIATLLAESTGIPVFRLSEEEASLLLHMEDELERRVVGQKDAITSVSKTVRRSRSGLKDPNRPAGSFLFAGPSGVGKTELSKALAEFLFGNEDALIVLDMSEYSEKHTVSRLFGSPPGFVGYDEGGQLTEKVRRKPFSVILFDEVEKAHPDIFNSLLQMLEEGRLTDAQGREVDFKNTIIIMTSNLGTRDISSISLGFNDPANETSGYEKMKAKVADELKNHFRPEFLNRIDDTVVFHQLTEQDVEQIVDIFITRVNNNLANKAIEIILSDETKKFLAEKGYDKTLGARPLRRTVQRYIEDPLSELLLEGEVKPGQTIDVGVKEGDDVLTFTPKKVDD